MQPIVIHLIPNAHLDPVWLWNWREGLTEMVNTTRTILDLMDEYPQLTFSRGEGFLYQAVEEADPAAFKRIQSLVEQGRWDVVGGTMLQSDMNLPQTETILRHLLYAQRYFKERFGRAAQTGWSADCFGHSAALPDLLAAAGLNAYAYSRPAHVPPHLNFWWEGPAGAKLLVHHPMLGWYGTERHELPARLDGLLKQAQAGGIVNAACFMGLGNHGGHPTRRQIADALAWAEAHPEVSLVYSTLTGFFEALSVEISEPGHSPLPVYRGELNFTTRGVYAANARFKAAFRKTEALLNCSERLVTGLAAAAEVAPFDLTPAWKSVLFNTFHDILPGSSAEGSYEEQFDWLGTAAHAARQAELWAANLLSQRVDTRVRLPADDMPAGVPLLVFNPHPWPYQGALDLEACLDYRPIWKYIDRPEDLPMRVNDPEVGNLPLQRVPCENLYALNLNLRSRVVVPVTLPAFGWKLLEFGYDEEAPKISVEDPTRAGENWIANQTWEVRADTGGVGIALTRHGQPVLGVPGLSVLTVEDPWGSWGDFNESPASSNLTTLRDAWLVTRVEVGERGPLRATLRVRLEGGRSRIDLSLSLFRGRDALDVSARVFWDERCAQLRLALPGNFTQAGYAVAGGSMTRGPLGDVPGGSWVRLESAAGGLGFASDALYAFNLTPEGDFHATVARATRYAAEGPAQVEEHPWAPSLDRGELRFRFLLTAGPVEALAVALPRLALELEQPPLVMHALPSDGDWGKTGSLLSLSPATMQLLAFKPAESGSGWVLRLQSFDSQTIAPVVEWVGQTFSLPVVAPHQVASYLLARQPGGEWTVQPLDFLEG